MDSMKTALSDFKTYVKNSKCSFGKFHLEVCEDEDDEEEGILNLKFELKQTLSSLDKQISVTDFSIRCNGNESVIIDVLPFFKAGTLTKVELDMRGCGDNLMELDQWNQVKEVEVRSHLPIAQLLHCNKFDIIINEFSLVEMKTITETAIRRLEQFDSFTVRSYSFVELADIESYMETEFPIVRNSERHRYRKIQEANCYLRLYFDNWRLTIDKTLVIE